MTFISVTVIVRSNDHSLILNTAHIASVAAEDGADKRFRALITMSNGAVYHVRESQQQVIDKFKGAAT